jgi:hypothetical protein
VYEFVRRLPIRTIFMLLAVWLFLALVNLIFLIAGFHTDSPIWFPISVFIGPTIHVSGIPYLLLFLVVLALASTISSHLNIYHIWLVGFVLIVLGNLGQGDWDSAFHKPFYESGFQYYHDAIKIDSWSSWLASFNSNQSSLLMHTKTHPPFAVLIHYFLLQMSGDSIPFLSMAFLFLSSLSLVLVWNILRVLEVPLEKRNLLTLLFSVIPAVNIYSAVSLGGVILSSSTLFLFGMINLLKREPKFVIGVISFLIGLVITNYLTFSGVFLVAVAGVQAVRNFFVDKKFDVAISLVISIVVFVILSLSLHLAYGYNHAQAFLTASYLENPKGFMGWSEPLVYLFTRIENVSEIALFLSVGFLAVLFHPSKLSFSWSDWRTIEIGVTLSGLITLLAMFLTGAFRTGETARAALFVYPYIMLTLTKANSRSIKDLITLAGLQTSLLQLFGGYFW